MVARDLLGLGVAMAGIARLSVMALRLRMLTTFGAGAAAIGASASLLALGRAPALLRIWSSARRLKFTASAQR
jgi:hypothetical protein